MVKTTELRLHAPNLRLQEDGLTVRQALLAAPGIGTIELDHRTGNMRIETANQDGGVDVRQRLADAGYPVTEVEAV
jgi:hypothetical protein